MRNNEYTATPNWFKQEPTDNQANIYLTNYYIGGSSTSGSSVLSSISLYNKYIINTYTLTVDDLIIPNTAIIAVDSELPEGQERPEEFVSEIGNLVSAENWYTSYSIRVLSGTTIKANLKANTSRYGIVFYDKYNTPISGYTPSEDKLVEILVPDSANYFRCCHYIDSNAGSDSFYIEYQSVDKYNDDLLNEAYSGTFEDFTSINSDIQEGIIKDTINNTLLKLIFQQPLQFTTDKAGNIKVELNNDVLKDSLLSDNYVTTIENNPQDILSLKDFRQGLKINGIEIVEKDGFVYIKGDVAVTGGITAYALGDRTPSTILDGLPIDETTLSKEGGKLTVIGGTGGGVTNWDELLGKPSWIGDVKPTYTWNEILGEAPFYTKAEIDGKYVTVTTEQEVTGLKHFINGISIGSNKKKIYEQDGIVYIDSDVAVTGGITAFALGGREVSTIMDGIAVDNITIIKEDGVLKVVGSAGSSFDEEAMWTALSSSDSSKQINASHLSNALSGYATQSWVTSNNYATQSWVQSQGYATQSALNSVSSKLNDFLEGSDTDSIINKWKELEAFLSGMTESDNLADILSTKADKSYVDTELTKYVTLATEQDITSIKHFTQGLSVGNSKHKIYEKDGAIILDGNLLVTGGVTAYSDESSSGGSSGGIDVDSLWAILGGTGTQQINKSHLTDALNGYATESWVNSKNYATKATTLAGYGITDAYTKTESDSRFVNVSGDTMTGNLQINSSNSSNGMLKLNSVTEESSLSFLKNGTPYITFGITSYANDSYNSNYLGFYDNANIYGEGNKWYKIWHAGNDGSGSGLDADTVDGKHFSYFHRTHRTDISDLTKPISSDTVTFDYAGPTGGPGGWINAFVSTHNSYLSSFIANVHRTDNWFLGWRDTNSNTGNWRQIAFVDSNVASATNSDMLDGLQSNMYMRVIKQFGRGGGLSTQWVKIVPRETYAKNSFLISRYIDGKVATYLFNYCLYAPNYSGLIQISGGVLEPFGWYYDNSLKCYYLELAGNSDFEIVTAYNGGAEEIYSVVDTPTGTAYTSRTIAGLDSNVASATKLQTSRTLWGQSFDGTNNVVGNLILGAGNAIICSNGVSILKDHNNSNVTVSAAKGDLYLGYDYTNNIRFYSGNANGVGTEKMTLLSNGNFGIGTTSPVAKLDVNGTIKAIQFYVDSIYGMSYLGNGNGDNATFSTHNIKLRTWWGLGIHDHTDTCRIIFDARTGKIATTGSVGIGTENPSTNLHVVGNILSTGGITCYSSDERAKTIIEELNLSLKQISESPTIRFKWNGWNIKDDGKTHLGGIAQYVQKLLPECILDADGVLNMDYATTAYVYSVLTARHLQIYETKTDKEIRNLKNRIKLLEKLLKKLSYEEIDTMVN